MPLLKSNLFLSMVFICCIGNGKKTMAVKLSGHDVGLWLADFPCPVPNLWLTDDRFVRKLSALGQPTWPINISPSNFPIFVLRWFLWRILRGFQTPLEARKYCPTSSKCQTKYLLPDNFKNCQIWLFRHLEMPVGNRTLSIMPNPPTVLLYKLSKRFECSR